MSGKFIESTAPNVLESELLTNIPQDTLERLPMILDRLGHMSIKNIAVDTGFERLQIYRDMKFLEDLGWYKGFILESFMTAKKNLPDTDEAKLVYFREMSKLLGKIVTRKGVETKINTTGDVHVTVKSGEEIKRVLIEYREVFESERRVIPNEYITEPLAPVPSPKETS